MSIDELLGLSVAELEALTDEQLLERYKPIFDLEPQVALEDIKDDEDDNEVSPTPKQTKKSANKTKLADIKKKLMEASKAGLSADDLFEKDFG